MFGLCLFNDSLNLFSITANLSEPGHGPITLSLWQWHLLEKDNTNSSFVAMVSNVFRLLYFKEIKTQLTAKTQKWGLYLVIVEGLRCVFIFIKKW